MIDTNQQLSAQIRASEQTRQPVETALKTDERVLARITDGIYRQPASALRELISNAYDADATEVIILTDAPRFSQISVRDNGRGLTPEVLEHLINHIGGSAKRADEGKQLGVTAADDKDCSPSGRQLIGKLGIGLFSVAQFTRHFLIITKTKGDTYRTVVDITLGPVAGQQKLPEADSNGHRAIERAHARIWRERADEHDAQGTEIRLFELLPRTRAELASDDLWTRVEYEIGDPDAIRTQPPQFHIGRMMPGQTEVLQIQPKLPWQQSDSPRERFAKFVESVRHAAVTMNDSVDLELFCDHYLQTLWNLALAAPLKYIDGHPFDLTANDDVVFFELQNRMQGQARQLALKNGQTPRQELDLKSPDGTTVSPFEVFVDGVQLFRPIVFKGLPKTANAVQTPLLFVGRQTEQFNGKPVELSGGPLIFEAYLFWAPKIVPKQHQGVVLRVGNASGALFDRTFMGYQVQEQQRTRQITAEVFVSTGLDGAINLDRESFNYAHPHYQYLVKWLHSALRQFANRHKEIGAKVRSEKVAARGELLRVGVEEKVENALRARGVEDVPEVLLLEARRVAEIGSLRSQGAIVLRKDMVMPVSDAKQTAQEQERRKSSEQKAIAITQLLIGMGLLDMLSHEEREKLIHDIVDIIEM